MRPLALILLLASAIYAQGVNGIVTSVSRTVTIAPDEGDFTVGVSATLDTTQPQVVQIFQNAGIQNLNVLSVAAGPSTSAYPPPAASQIYYAITFTVAPSALVTYAKRLDAFRANLPAALTSLQYSAVLNASQAAVDGARQAVLPQLVSDARAKAQALASAAGLKPGAIQGIAESFYGSAGVSGAFFSVSQFVLPATPSGTGTQYTFSATVTFAVAGQ